MANIIMKHCAICDDDMFIDIDNCTDVLKFNGKYFHTDCFESMCNDKLADKRSKKDKWQTALSQMSAMEKDTATELVYVYYRDFLNRHLLTHYNLVAVPKRFFTTVSELGNGNYRHKPCRPVHIRLLAEMWANCQDKLDYIAEQNARKHVGPTDDNQRLMYDLAILISKLPAYMKQKETTRHTINRFEREAEEYFKSLID